MDRPDMNFTEDEDKNEKRIERRIRIETSKRIRIEMTCSVCGKQIGVVRLPASIKELPEEINGENVIVHCTDCLILYNPDNLAYFDPGTDLSPGSVVTIDEDRQSWLAERYWKEGQNTN